MAATLATHVKAEALGPRIEAVHAPFSSPEETSQNKQANLRREQRDHANLTKTHSQVPLFIAILLGGGTVT